MRITGITDNGNSTLSWAYGYDSLDRVSGASDAAQSLAFTYDADGNRLTQSGSSNGSSANATFSIAGSSDQLSSVTGALARTYSYDAAGHTSAYGGVSFTYNAAGRLLTAVNGSTSSYIYDALGQRIQKATAAGTTAFVYDESGHLLGEYDGAGNAIQEIVWLGDTPVATVRQEACGLSIFYIHTDHLNTPRRITRRSTSDVVWSRDSDPFGAAGPNENPSGLGSFSFNLRFPGQYYDAETGLNYNYFRDYDPGTGRYIESDPVGLVAGVNTYAYVDGNPLMLIDPLGLAACGTPDRCAQLRKQIFAKSALLIKELLKYNPIEDAKGGFPMKWGDGFTKPGGHYQEIAQLQQGLKNDMAEYKRLCSNNGNWPPVPRAIDDAANRDVEQPIITPAPGISVPNSSPNLIAPAAGLGILGGLALLGILAL